MLGSAPLLVDESLTAIPVEGSNTFHFRSRNSVTYSLILLLCQRSPGTEGATTTGASVSSAVYVAKLPGIIRAVCDMKFSVAGLTITKSGHEASCLCGTE